jgi:hypothetical protein
MDSLAYPETLGYCFVINAPALFTMAWRVAKGWLSERTVGKVHILGGRSQWLPILAQHIPPEVRARGERGGGNES